MNNHSHCPRRRRWATRYAQTDGQGVSPGARRRRGRPGGGPGDQVDATIARITQSQSQSCPVVPVVVAWPVSRL